MSTTFVIDMREDLIMPAYQSYVYETDPGTTMKIRLADTTAAAHPAPAPTLLAGAAGVDLGGVSADVSGSRNVNGVHSRGLRLRRTIGTGVNRKSFFTFLPITTVAAYDAATVGQAITVNSVAYTVSAKVPERSR